MIQDGPGYLPFGTSGGTQPFHLLRKLDKRVSAVITTKLGIDAWAPALDDAKTTSALLDRLTHRRQILGTGNDSYRFKASSESAKQKRKKAPALPTS